MMTSLRRIWIQMTADRRRFGVLCATLGVGLLLWARLIIVSQVPRTAMATGVGGSASGGATLRPGASSGTKNEGDKSDATRSNKNPSRRQIPIEVRLWNLSERDPFVISPEYFPSLTVSLPVKQEAGKLPTEQAEDSTQKEARMVARLREMAGMLRLEAAMGSSMAVIDGRQYRVGDRVPVVGKKGASGTERVEFELIEVKQRSAVVEAGGWRFELEMSIPGRPES